MSVTNQSSKSLIWSHDLTLMVPKTESCLLSSRRSLSSNSGRSAGLYLDNPELFPDLILISLLLGGLCLWGAWVVQICQQLTSDIQQVLQLLRAFKLGLLALRVQMLVEQVEHGLLHIVWAIMIIRTLTAHLLQDVEG